MTVTTKNAVSTPAKFEVGKRYRTSPDNVRTITVLKRNPTTIDFCLNGDEAKIIRRKLYADSAYSHDVEAVVYGSNKSPDYFWVVAKDVVDDAEIEQVADTVAETEISEKESLELDIKILVDEIDEAREALAQAEADSVNETEIEDKADTVSETSETERVAENHIAELKAELASEYKFHTELINTLSEDSFGHENNNDEPDENCDEYADAMNYEIDRATKRIERLEAKIANS